MGFIRKDGTKYTPAGEDHNEHVHAKNEADRFKRTGGKAIFNIDGYHGLAPRGVGRGERFCPSCGKKRQTDEQYHDNWTGENVCKHCSTSLAFSGLRGMRRVD